MYMIDNCVENGTLRNPFLIHVGLQSMIYFPSAVRKILRGSE